MFTKRLLLLLFLNASFSQLSAQSRLLKPFMTFIVLCSFASNAVAYGSGKACANLTIENEKLKKDLADKDWLLGVRQKELDMCKQSCADLTSCISRVSRLSHDDDYDEALEWPS